MRDIVDILDIVDKLNSHLEDNNTGSSVEFLEFLSNGRDIVIKFLGETIWSSLEDTRKFIEEENRYEYLEQYLKMQCNKKISDLQLQSFI